MKSDEQPFSPLVGQIFTQMSKDTAFTTEALLAAQQEQLETLAAGILSIEKTLREASVIDRKTEARLKMYETLYERAEMILDKSDG